MLKKKLNLGSAMPPVHPQHLEVMSDYENWQLVDLYVTHPEVLKMDARTLDQVPDSYLETIYASHLLEHLPHPELPDILQVWHRKLQKGGELIINVPDLIWACKRLLKWEAGQLLEGEYSEFEGDRGLQSIFYGTHAHEGERHQAGFTRKSLYEWLDGIGFKDIYIDQWEDAHDMGVLLARCKKSQ